MCKVFAILKGRLWGVIAILIFIISLLIINNYSSNPIFPSNFPTVSVGSLKEKNASFNFSCSLVDVENRDYAIVGDRIDCIISYKGLIEANTNFPFVDFGLVSPSSVKKIWDFYRWEEYATGSSLRSNFESLSEEGTHSVYLFVRFGNETINDLTTFQVYSLTTSSTARNNRNLLFVAALSLSFSIFVAFKNLRDLFQKKRSKVK